MMAVIGVIGFVVKFTIMNTEFHQSTFERTEMKLNQQINCERIFWCICAAAILCLLLPLVGCGGSDLNSEDQGETEQETIMVCYGDVNFVGPCQDSARMPVSIIVKP